MCTPFPLVSRCGSGMGAMRTCKHLKGLRGDAAELERLGGSHTAFYKTGSNRVVGQDGGSGGGGGGGGAPSSMTSNDAIVRSVALAEAWDGAEPCGTRDVKPTDHPGSHVSPPPL